MEKFFKKLIILTDKTKKSGDIPVSCLIVDDKLEIVSQGVNNRIKQKNIAGHAEIVTINKLMKKKKLTNLQNFKIISILEPCNMCFEAIKQAKINELYFFLPNEKFGFTNGNNKEEKQIKWKQIGDETQRKEYAKILANFFKDKR